VAGTSRKNWKCIDVFSLFDIFDVFHEDFPGASSDAPQHPTKSALYWQVMDRCEMKDCIATQLCDWLSDADTDQVWMISPFVDEETLSTLFSALPKHVWIHVIARAHQRDASDHHISLQDIRNKLSESLPTTNVQFWAFDKTFHFKGIFRKLNSSSFDVMLTSANFTRHHIGDCATGNLDIVVRAPQMSPEDFQEALTCKTGASVPVGDVLQISKYVMSRSRSDQERTLYQEQIELLGFAIKFVARLRRGSLSWEELQAGEEQLAALATNRAALDLLHAKQQ